MVQTLQQQLDNNCLNASLHKQKQPHAWRKRKQHPTILASAFLGERIRCRSILQLKTS